MPSNSRNFSRSYLEPRVGRIEQIAGITPIIYNDGRARDTRGFLVRSGGGLEFECLADRALDIASASYRGIPLAWHGPAGIAHPSYYAPTDDEFQRNFFGGLLTTCGLNAFGPPGKDRWGSWGQHGRVNHLPAQNVGHELRWSGEKGTLYIWGSVYEYEMFGEMLKLERRWSIDLGSSRLMLHDRVSNDGGTATPHMMLYHCNAGYPLLDAQSRLEVTANEVRPRDDAARAGLSQWNCGGEPMADFAEQVFIHRPTAGADGLAEAAFNNSELGLTLAIRFSVAELPAFFNWRMLGIKTYVMGLEAANCSTIEGRLAAQAAGTLPFLEPGQSREYHVIFEIREHA